MPLNLCKWCACLHIGCIWVSWNLEIGSPVRQENPTVHHQFTWNLANKSGWKQEQVQTITNQNLFVLFTEDSFGNFQSFCFLHVRFFRKFPGECCDMFVCPINPTLKQPPFKNPYHVRSFFNNDWAPLVPTANATWGMDTFPLSTLVFSAFSRARYFPNLFQSRGIHVWFIYLRMKTIKKINHLCG